jgi:hypothetical protein
VNGDGVNDFAIGAWNYDYDGERGRVVILSGDTTVRVDAHEPMSPLPTDLSLSAYPNPFNARTTVQLEVPYGVSTITLITYNVLGQQVAKQTVRAAPGVLHVSYDAHDLSSGVYLLRAQAGTSICTQKLMLLN